MRERVFSHLWWWHRNAVQLVSQSHRLWHSLACHTSYNLISEIHPVALLASALLPVDAARRGTFLWMVHKELLNVINKTSASKSRLKASNKDEKEQIMTISQSVITYAQRFAIPDIWTINSHALAKIIVLGSLFVLTNSCISHLHLSIYFILQMLQKTFSLPVTPLVGKSK